MLPRRSFTVRNREWTRAQTVCCSNVLICLLLYCFVPFSAHRAVSPGIAFPFAGMLGYDFLISRGAHCVVTGKTSTARKTETATALQFDGRVDAEKFPADRAWENAPAMRFRQDWQGKHADRKRETEVRLLWTREVLYLRFLAHYRSITVFPDAEPSGRRDQLWDRDVVEVFLQPAGFDGPHYKEFEVSPNGFWIDLDIGPGEKRNLRSGLRRRVKVDEHSKTWMAEMALPMKSLTAQFDPTKAWRVNFFRVEGATEPRFYSAWRPTGTTVPNFHVPEAFDTLVFET
jgi:Carbohydrate family 9 binding domain-like